MVRFLAALVMTFGLALPAAASVVALDPDVPANSSRTVFTTESFNGSGITISAPFTLLADAPVRATISAVGLSASISMFELTDGGGSQLISGTTMNPTSNLSFAFLEGDLAAGDYALAVTGDFTNAALSAEIAAVPLPGAALLLGSAVVGLVAYRRRARATA